MSHFPSDPLKGRNASEMAWRFYIAAGAKRYPSDILDHFGKRDVFPVLQNREQKSEKYDTLPETNSKFAPENGWLEY